MGHRPIGMTQFRTAPLKPKDGLNGPPFSSLRLGEYAKASGVEDIGPDFAFVALRRDFFAVQLEANACGVSRLDDNFAAGANGGVRGGDQGFLGYGFAVGHDGDPGGFLGANQQAQLAWRSRRSGSGSLHDEWIRAGRVGWRRGGGASSGFCLGCRRDRCP